MERPIHEMLSRAAGARRGHMPGHKGQAPFGVEDLFRLDTTELDLTDNLYQPAGAIRRAETLWARAAGAGASLLLTGGATAGIHTMLRLWAREGDTVILPRNAHLSAVNGCALGGLEIAWVPLRQTADGYPWAAEEDVLAVMEAHPEAKTLLLTRPDYYGVCQPLEGIAAACRRRGIRLIVDEAHGAHLPWLGGPRSAGELADAWVQSAHKTLPALTGAAVLHLRDEADEGRARRLLHEGQSSSPSFLLLQSLDDARCRMEKDGAARLAALMPALRALREALPALGYMDAHERWRQALPEGTEFDPTRLVIAAPQGGEELYRQLAERGFVAEMADERRLVWICTAADSPEDIDALREALAACPAHAAELPPPPPLPDLPEKVMPPRRAVMLPEKAVPLREAAGQIAAQSFGLYPPGVPLCVPGERVEAWMTERMRAAPPAHCFGMEGDRLLCADV